MVNEAGSTKQRVLDVLKQNDRAVSGTELAGLLNVTRTSVWKAVQSLQSSGYMIRSQKNGYMLDMAHTDSLCPLEFGKDSGRYIHFAETDSTMNQARRTAFEALSRNDTSVKIITADTQSDGRGCGGRKWKTTRGALAFTMVTFPGLTAEEAPREIMACQIAMARTLSRISGRDFFVRWPNDVWSGEGKVCGILDETFSSAGRCSFMNIGIGVNISSSPNLACADRIFFQEPSCRRKDILSGFFAEYSSMQSLVTDDSRELQDMWNQLNCDSDKKINVVHKGEYVFRGIDGLGRAVLDSAEDGKRHVFARGSMRYEKH